ncbi:MAG: Brp/Blh family beta-carotene 15,15'-dioxygenase, partial [Thermus sp.]|nr:Brp/Blh family beta-carotene 15,15'-dioxygenase [Thermus sp.]
MRSAFLLPLVLLPGDWSLGLLLLSALVLGLPHGAADLLLARRLAWPMGSFLAAYLLLAGLALALLLLFPPLGFLFFLGLALFHWGRVEAKGPLGYWRAGTVLLFPFAFHRDEILPFLQAFAGGFALAPGMALVLWGLLGLWALGHRPPWSQLGDTLLLALVALWAHPYAALAGYFILQHSWDSLSLVGVRGRDWLWVYLATLGGLIL